MDDFKPNSNRFENSKPKSKIDKNTEEIPVKKQKVVTGPTKIRKKNGVQKIANRFIVGDAKNIKEYIVDDVIVPKLKTLFATVLTTTIDMLFGIDLPNSSSGNASRVSYGGFYKSQSNVASKPRVNNSFNYDSILFDTRVDAEMVLDAMRGSIEQYNIVSVADMYDFAQVSTDNPQLNKYGWIDLSTASVARTIDGEYILKLPRALPFE